MNGLWRKRRSTGQRDDRDRIVGYGNSRRLAPTITAAAPVRAVQHAVRGLGRPRERWLRENNSAVVMRGSSGRRHGARSLRGSQTVEPANFVRWR